MHHNVPVLMHFVDKVTDIRDEKKLGFCQLFLWKMWKIGAKTLLCKPFLKRQQKIMNCGVCYNFIFYFLLLNLALSAADHGVVFCYTLFLWNVMNAFSSFTRYYRFSVHKLKWL